MAKMPFFTLTNHNDEDVCQTGLDNNSPAITSNSTVDRLLFNNLPMGSNFIKGNFIGDNDQEQPTRMHKDDFNQLDNILYDYLVLGIKTNYDTLTTTDKLLEQYQTHQHDRKLGQFYFYKSTRYDNGREIYYLFINMGKLRSFKQLKALIQSAKSKNDVLAKLITGLSQKDCLVDDIDNRSIITLPQGSPEINPYFRKSKNNTQFIELKEIANSSHINKGTLADILKAKLGDEFVSDARLAPDKAGDEIMKVFPPYISDGEGNEADRLVIFNPLTGLYINDYNEFHALISTVKPYISDPQLKTMIAQFAATAHNRNAYIKTYNGSRYLLFKNGCLDVKTMELHPLDSQLVQDLHFSTRNHLNIDYQPNPACPVITQGREDGGDWNVQDWINAYANNDSEVLRMLLFGLSLGLFGGHNFGVHFDIMGESRWGKSTLAQIFRSLYSGNVFEIRWSQLNGSFPFTNFNNNLSVIWINECNSGAKPLDDVAIATYDALADAQASLEIKNKNNLILDNPPQVYIDGTQLVQFDDKTTGPLGRTMAFELPGMTDELRNQMRVIRDINAVLSNEQVLQWLVFQMIMAYKDIVPKAQINSFKVKDAGETTLMNQFPTVAKQWRDELGVSTDDVMEFFQYWIEPYINDNPKDQSEITLMHPDILYNSYRKYHREINQISDNAPDRFCIQKKKFVFKINKVMDKLGYTRELAGNAYGNRKPQKRVSDPDTINFEWANYAEDHGQLYSTPFPQSAPEPFGKLKTGWFYLHRQ